MLLSLSLRKHNLVHLVAIVKIGSSS
jgi:hypothetical protein